MALNESFESTAPDNEVLFYLPISVGTIHNRLQSTQKAQGNRVSKILTQARQRESTAIALVGDVKHTDPVVKP